MSSILNFNINMTLKIKVLFSRTQKDVKCIVGIEKNFTKVFSSNNNVENLLIWRFKNIIAFFNLFITYGGFVNDIF